MNPDEETIKRYRNDSFLNHALNLCKQHGLNETETWKKITFMLLDIKSECFNKALDEARRKPGLTLFVREKNNGYNENN